jgi:hypothetical protein
MMPETFGKRQRQSVKNRKAAAREERRVKRNQRREARAADPSREEAWLGAPNPTGVEDLTPGPAED